MILLDSIKAAGWLFVSEIGKLLIRCDRFVRRNEEIEKRKETKVWSNVNDADVDWKRAFNVIYWKLNWFAFLFFFLHGVFVFFFWAKRERIRLREKKTTSSNLDKISEFRVF